jgi:hypothetical protein
VTRLEALPVPLSHGSGERMGRLCADLPVHRDDATDATVALHRDGVTLVDAQAINAPKLLLPYRRMIADRIRWEDALVAC